MADLLTEKNDFVANMAAVREKICTEWMTRDRMTRMHVCAADHQMSLQSLQAKAHEIQSMLSETVANTEEKEKACTRDEEEKNSLLQHEAEVEQKNDRLLQEREVLDQDISSLEQDSDKLKHDLAEQREQVDRKTTELQKSVKMFQDCLGLRFKKVSGDRLQVVYTCLDSRRLDVNANFCVKITNEQKSYMVTSCEPPVRDLDTLVEKLNTTNDFKSFVIVMRKRFKEIM